MGNYIQLSNSSSEQWKEDQVRLIQKYTTTVKLEKKKDKGKLRRCNSTNLDAEAQAIELNIFSVSGEM